MFYTRPRIPPLNLDLVRLDGGGSCPSQFFGTTTDGQSLYVRYRNGWLSASFCANGGEPGPNDEELLSQDIGPAYHGDILMEQVCDLLGLTLFGTKPPFTEADRAKAAEQAPILDWSGRTTYLEERLQATRAGADGFVAALGAEFRDVCILEAGFDAGGRFYRKRGSASECGHVATLGLEADRGRLEALLGSGNATIVDCNAAFSHVVGFQLEWDRRPDKDRFHNYSEFHGKFFRAFGDGAVLADRNYGSIRSEFATDGDGSAEFVRKLYEAVDACFSRRAAWVTPQGEVLQLFDKHTLHSGDLADWCRQSQGNCTSWTEKDFGAGMTIAGMKAL